MDGSSISQVNAMVQAMTAPAQTAQAVDVAVLGKALDAATMQNSALLEMMRDTLNPSVGGTLDISA